MIKVSILNLGLAIGLLGCGYTKTQRIIPEPNLNVIPYGGGNALPGADAVPGPSAPPTPLVSWNKAVDDLIPPTYEGDIKPKLDTFCISCHTGAAAKAGLDLSSFDNVKTNIAKIANVVELGKMPPAANQLDDEKQEELERLTGFAKDWARAPSNFANSLADLSSLNFVSDISPLNDKICATCHSGPDAKANLHLASRIDWSNNYEAAMAALNKGIMPPGMDSERRSRMILLFTEWNARKLP